jgi:hypothetical protein
MFVAGSIRAFGTRSAAVVTVWSVFRLADFAISITSLLPFSSQHGPTKANLSSPLTNRAGIFMSCAELSDSLVAMTVLPSVRLPLGENGSSVWLLLRATVEIANSTVSLANLTNQEDLRRSPNIYVLMPFRRHTLFLLSAGVASRETVVRFTRHPDPVSCTTANWLVRVTQGLARDAEFFSVRREKSPHPQLRPQRFALRLVGDGFGCSERGRLWPKSCMFPSTRSRRRKEPSS